MKTVIEMAREAGLFTHKEVQPELERLVELARADAIADEREACAKVCEQSEIPIPIDVWHGSTKKEMTEHTALTLAKAIRARGNT